MKTKHLPLIVGIALPVLFIIGISLTVFLANASVKPQHNFVYTSGSSYDINGNRFAYTYKLTGSQIVMEPVKRYADQPYAEGGPSLYLYDVVRDVSREVSFAEVQNLRFEPGPSSPDGYNVRYEYNNDGIFELFGSNSDDRGYVIENKRGKKKLSGIQEGRYGYGEGFQIIGWVK